MIRTLAPLLIAVSLTACQSLPGVDPDIGENTVLLSAQHCLEEPVGDNKRIHYGPCLKITEINGSKPRVRDDGFIALPASQPVEVLEVIGEQADQPANGPVLPPGEPADPPTPAQEPLAA